MASLVVPEIERPDRGRSNFVTSCTASVKRSAHRFSAWARGLTAKDLGIFVAAAATMYSFLVGLAILGSGAKLLGGRAAGDLFKGIADPVGGLMVGVLATVLVQSSSTSTSIVVSLVGANIIGVREAIPVIMGANIGTSVTNTIVSVGHAGRSAAEFARAFSAATVHDLFNLLNVALLMPIEALFAWANGEGGPLYWASVALTEPVAGVDASDADFKSPVKTVVSPLVKALLSIDKNKLKALSFGRPTLDTCIDTVKAGVDFGVCGNATRLSASTAAWDAVRDGTLLKGGALHEDGMGDEAAGIITVLTGITITVVSLVCIVRILVYVMKKRAEREILNAGRSSNACVGITTGTLITILVQSSSITTSVLTPLVATGALSLAQAFPITLGANIGTCGTALIASMVAGTRPALQIALVHLMFNLVGIVVWFPARFHIIEAARRLGELTRRFRWLPAAYTMGVFVVAPLVLFVLSLAIGGLAVALSVLAAVLAAAAWRCFRPRRPGPSENQVESSNHR